MEKPRLSLQHSVPPKLPPAAPAPLVRMYGDRLHAAIKETRDGLVKWSAYLDETREAAIEDGTGNTYVVLVKDIISEPTGLCPFILRIKRSGTGFRGYEAPGVVLFEGKDGSLTPVTPTYNGAKITNIPPPKFSISVDESVWHIHWRNASGRLAKVHIVISKEKPHTEKNETALKMATFKRSGKRLWIQTFVAGVYVLTSGDGSSSSSSSSPSSSSSSPKSSGGSSKTAIYPFEDTYVSQCAMEAPEPVFMDLMSVKLSSKGDGIAIVDPRFLAGIKPETLVVSSVAPNAMVMACGWIERLGTQVVAFVKCPPHAGKAATHANVGLHAVAAHSPGRWIEYTAAQYESNKAFYASAYEPK